MTSSSCANFIYKAQVRCTQLLHLTEANKHVHLQLTTSYKEGKQLHSTTWAESADQNKSQPSRLTTLVSTMS